MAHYKPITGGPTNEPSPGVIERALTFLIDCQLAHEGRERVGPVTFTKRTPEELAELRRKDPDRAQRIVREFRAKEAEREKAARREAMERGA